ncbi:MAG: hypothetical protein A49_02890 [Methyloceanibacter sp.]|nr:MAG: hypothetical protein A49_02890 [Methyloceanibacter sp.]
MVLWADTPICSLPRQARGAHIGIGELVGGDDFARRLVELGHGVRHFEVENFGGFAQALIVLGQLEDFAVIGTHPLEHSAAIVERMGQQMHLRIGPRNKLAIEPDHALTVVKTRHRSPPLGGGAPVLPQASHPMHTDRPEVRPRGSTPGTHARDARQENCASARRSVSRGH